MPSFLLVHPDAAAAARLTGLLERDGFPAVSCPDPERALAEASRTDFGLALIHASPGMAAAGLCRRLLGLAVPVRSVLFADSCSPADRAAAFSARAVGFHQGPEAGRRLLEDVRRFSADRWRTVIPRSGHLGRGREVLVIDDDPQIAMAAAWELGAAGFAASLAEDGRSGLLAAARRRPHAVLLDVNLPDLSLEEMAPALKADPGGPALLLWTGLDGAARERRYLELGADDFTVKAVHPLDSLPLRVARVLERPRAPAARAAFGRLRLDHAARTVWLDEEEVAALTQKEFAIVAAAASGGPEGVRWRKLDALVDGRPEDACPDAASGSVRVHLRYARKKLAGTGVALRTLPGFGLRLEAPA